MKLYEEVKEEIEKSIGFKLCNEYWEEVRLNSDYDEGVNYEILGKRIQL